MGSAIPARAVTEGLAVPRRSPGRLSADQRRMLGANQKARRMDAATDLTALERMTPIHPAEAGSLGHVISSCRWEIMLRLLRPEEHDFRVCILARAARLPISAEARHRDLCCTVRNPVELASPAIFH